MSLRNRLFLWVSALFLMSAFLSTVVQYVVTQRALKKSQEELCRKIMSSKEEVRESLQNFLSNQIINSQAKIDVLLTSISQSRSQLQLFAPTISNYNHGTWAACADCLEKNRDIDFIQNTNEGKSTATIIPISSPFPHAVRIPIDQELSWVFFESTPTTPAQVMLGVRLFDTYQTHFGEQTGEEVIQEPARILPEIYVMYPRETLAAQSASMDKELASSPPVLSLPWMQGHDISLQPFFHALERARVALRNGALVPPEMSSKDIHNKLDGNTQWEEILLNPFSNEQLKGNLVGSEQFLLERANMISLRNGEINIFWILLSMHHQQLTGDSVFSFPAPTAVGVFKDNNNAGPVIQVRSVLYPSPTFDDADYFAKNPAQSDLNLASNIAIIAPDGQNRVFLGNTAQFKVRTPEKERIGYLTLGIDADEILDQTVLTLEQTALLVSQGKILSAFSPEGRKIIPSSSQQAVLPQILDQTTGIVDWEGTSYFFMQITPFPLLDLHFFVLNPVEKEFTLLRSLEEGSQQVVDSIIFNIRVCGVVVLAIALILLQYFSRSISAPIAELSKSTQEILKGQLDQVKISPKYLKRDDEIATLCHSFEEMVTGLKEKEKVKGVLNKVVSQEIAQEILAGSIHLGGEQKRVTVLFADIRNFTQMTQTMLPQDVVDLLNTCMTKMSHVIDQHGGVIDKFVGDEIMALFGAPIQRSDSALQAVTSAFEMIDALAAWNRERQQKKLASVEMGIGIHTGEMLAGNMGAENRLNYTVIGSNVNLVARMCSAAKGMQILISEDTLNEAFIRDRFLVEQMPPMSFKGFNHPVTIYRITGKKS